MKGLDGVGEMELLDLVLAVAGDQAVGQQMVAKRHLVLEAMMDCDLVLGRLGVVATASETTSVEKRSSRAISIDGREELTRRRAAAASGQEKNMRSVLLGREGCARIKSDSLTMLTAGLKQELHFDLVRARTSAGDVVNVLGSDSGWSKTNGQ